MATQVSPTMAVEVELRPDAPFLEQTFATLAYFDGAVLCRTATAPALFSVGLRDDTCPPSTVFAAINVYGGRSGA